MRKLDFTKRSGPRGALEFTKESDDSVRDRGAAPQAWWQHYFAATLGGGQVTTKPLPNGIAVEESRDGRLHHSRNRVAQHGKSARKRWNQSA